MNIIELLIDEDKFDYKCYDELKKLLKNNEEFKQKVITGYLNGMISGYNEELWKNIHSQNIRTVNSFEDVFVAGKNIGCCTGASRQLSYSFEDCYICGGTLPILKGTKNCEDGSHTWILHDHKIIDTTLMLIIDEEYAPQLGYVEENRYNPNFDSVYTAAKEFAMDPGIKKNK